MSLTDAMVLKEGHPDHERDVGNLSRHICLGDFTGIGGQSQAMHGTL